ncbi:hypothetical protein AOQ84DRAFT_366460 [Glonium stellatum]|uniref:Uncharacterized protein n=1 Tax=Glonium stellatum TaxID=574774 RepID=A0A8E2JQA1_9PEZI|nr:hypothetical protein AOQ84DRAFT_366460 [Glonium stellatum]
MYKNSRQQPKPMEIDESGCMDVDPPSQPSPTTVPGFGSELDNHPCPAELIERLSDTRADATPWPTLLSPYLPDHSDLLQNFYLFVAGAHMNGIIAENKRLTTEAYGASRSKLDAKSDLRWSTLYNHYIKCPWEADGVAKPRINNIRQAPESTVRGWKGQILLMKVLVALEAGETIMKRNARLEEYKRAGWKGLLTRDRMVQEFGD